MSMFVKATPAPGAKTAETKQVSILYAGLLTVMAVTQLFTFEEFIELFPSFNLPLGDVLVYGLAPALVAAEVFALPFLLRMTVSPAFRFVSMLCGWFVAATWLFISTWVASTRIDADTIGFLGTLAGLTPGWWAVLISLALGVLAAWASWGLWPLRRTKK